MNNVGGKHNVSGGRIDYDASPAIRNVLSGITRTEDVRLSPDNSRLAIVEFICNRIFLFSIRIDNVDRGDVSPGIVITDYSVITSASLRNPHGAVFLGNDYLLVCNRAADVCLFRLPPPGNCPRDLELKPQRRINGKGMLLAKVKTPGSVDCHELGDNRYRVLVCNNHWHFVSSHIVSPGHPAKISHQGTLIQARLKIPDGISISRDNGWIAISNHVDGEILIYKNTADLNRETVPAAVLKGMVCPHGVRFDGNDRVIVADAASQYVHVFNSWNGLWRGVQYPARSIRLLDDETFYDGRYDSREGGVKGIDLDKSGRVLITTHRLGTLGFHDLGVLLSREDKINEAEMAELCRQRDQSLERQKGGVLNQQWSVKSRALHALSRLQWEVRQYNRRVRTGLKMSHLYLRNRWSSEPALDPSGPVLSLTTHSHRLARVFYTIESIATGSRKPGRIILWLSDEESCSNPPVTLRRLVSRGLEIHLTEDLGPHTKYYPYIDRERDLVNPLVTADDDMMYPRDWLKRLIRSYESNTSAIHCFRVHRIGIRNGRFTPYNEWFPCKDMQPSHCNFITGVSGVIYPPGYLKYLRQQGRAFTQYCPSGDDIWLSVNALRGRFRIAQVEGGQCEFMRIPGTQDKCLYDINVLCGQNQVQLRRTYSEADLSTLLACAEASGVNLD
jgi:hypothetical protein